MIFQENLQLLLLRRGETTSALKVYARLGQMLLDAGKLDEAERLYRHVLEQNPPDGDFLLPVCKTFLEAGRSSVVREFLTFAVARSPENAELKVLLVRSHLSHGETSAALETARGILASDPNNAEVRSLVGGTFRIANPWGAGAQVPRSAGATEQLAVRCRAAFDDLAARRDQPQRSHRRSQIRF